MKRRALHVALVAATLLAASSAVAHLVDTRGGVTCAMWMQQRPKNSQLLEAWLLGYMSGLAQEADIHLPKAVDNDEMFRWMDDYCKKNPKKIVTLGGFIMFNKLRADGSLKL